MSANEKEMIIKVIIDPESTNKFTSSLDLQKETLSTE
jgi:hypothetical protein